MGICMRTVACIWRSFHKSLRLKIQVQSAEGWCRWICTWPGSFFCVVVVCFQKQRQNLPVYIHMCKYKIYIFICVFDREDPGHNYCGCIPNPRCLLPVYVFILANFCPVPNTVVPLHGDTVRVKRSPQTWQTSVGVGPQLIPHDQWIPWWQFPNDGCACEQTCTNVSY